MAAYPNALVFGSVIKGQNQEARKIKLVGLEGKPIKLSSANCDNPHFQTSLKSFAGGRQYELSVSVDGDMKQDLERDQRGVIEIALDHPKYPIFSLPVRAEFVNAVEVTPAKWVVRPGRGNSRKSILVKCYDLKATDFQVTHIYYASGDRKQELETKQVRRGNRIRLDITLPGSLIEPTPADAANKASGPRLEIKTNYPGFDSMVVPVEVEFTDGPKGNIAPKE